MFGLLGDQNVDEGDAAHQNLAQTGSTATKTMEIQFDLNSPDFDEVDWRGLMSGVKDQGFCNSNWAFMTSSVAEGMHAIKNRLSKAPRVSEQESLDCAFNAGCSWGGWPN